MIEVKINDESFAYDIHSLIQAFYPGKEVQVREKETFTEYLMKLNPKVERLFLFSLGLI